MKKKLISVLQEAGALDFKRFFLPDGIIPSPKGVNSKRLPWDRLLIVMGGEKNVCMSREGVLHHEILTRGDVMFFHKEVWEDQNFQTAQQLLCIVILQDRLRLVFYDTPARLKEGPAVFFTTQLPLPAFFSTIKALGEYNCHGDTHLFHLVRAAIALTLQECDRDEVPQAIGKQRFIRIRTYLEDNYMNPISRTDLSEHFQLTETYISSLFRKHANTGLWEYLMELRLNAAMAMLGNERLSIKEIAFHCGFASDIYFIRCFHRKYKTSPALFRNARKQ